MKTESTDWLAGDFVASADRNIVETRLWGVAIRVMSWSVTSAMSGAGMEVEYRCWSGKRRRSRSVAERLPEYQYFGHLQGT
jgi:hypothetical protein